MAQSEVNYKPVLVSSTLYRKLVHTGALCSNCNMPVNIHGGYVPCHTGTLILPDSVPVKPQTVAMLEKAANEAKRRYDISWELSANGKDDYRRGEARVAKELEDFIRGLIPNEVHEPTGQQ